MNRIVLAAVACTPIVLAIVGCQSDNPALDPVYNTTTPRAEVEMRGLPHDPAGDDQIKAAPGVRSDLEGASGTGVYPDGTPRPARSGVNDDSINAGRSDLNTGRRSEANVGTGETRNATGATNTPGRPSDGYVGSDGYWYAGDGTVWNGDIQIRGRDASNRDNSATNNGRTDTRGNTGARESGTSGSTGSNAGSAPQGTSGSTGSNAGSAPQGTSGTTGSNAGSATGGTSGGTPGTSGGTSGTSGGTSGTSGGTSGTSGGTSGTSGGTSGTSGGTSGTSGGGPGGR